MPEAAAIVSNQESAPRRPPRSDSGNIQSVDRALKLLETIAEQGGETTLTQIATQTGLNISTCHHLLATLLRRGYVSKVAGRRSYALGARIIHLSHSCLKSDLPNRARVYLDHINAVTGETVHLSVLQGDAIVTLLKREARHAVRVETGQIGKTDAAHATATGKAMMAWLPEGEIHRLLSVHGMKRFTPKTITDPQVFIEELRLVRRSGFALDREEFHAGVTCVGSAIRDHSGAVLGAISVSAPTMRTGESEIAQLRDEVTSAARALSAAFGGADIDSQPTR